MATPSPSPTAAPVLATVSRSGRAESWHRGAVAVWHEDELLLAVGDVTAGIWCRSAVKPLQVLPLLELGVADRLGIGDEELVVACASHDGSERPVRIVQGLLARAGLSAGQLGCGPHPPLAAAARRALVAAGTEPGRVHNNCSGKHAGFLCLSRALGDDLAAYLDPQSRGQQAVQAAVAAMAGVAPPLPTGTDGCGAPTFALGLCDLARAFARLANPGPPSAVRAAACRRILDAAGRAPDLLAGERRLGTALLRSMPGRILPKNGAEGVYAVALAPDPGRRACPGGTGIAVKVHDGAERGYLPVVVDLLRHLGSWGGEVPAELAAFHEVPLHNTRGARIGEVRSAVDWVALPAGEQSTRGHGDGSGGRP